MEPVVQQSFKHSHYHTTVSTRGTLWGGKYHRCSRGLPSSQTTEGLEGRILRWNPTSSAQSIESKNSLAGLCIKLSGFLGGTKSWAKHRLAKKGGRGALNTEASFSLTSLEMFMLRAFKKISEIIQPKLDNTQNGFRPGCSTADQIFTFRLYFWKSWEHATDVCACFENLKKAYDRVACKKNFRECWGSLVLTDVCYRLSCRWACNCWRPSNHACNATDLFNIHIYMRFIH